MFSNSDRPLSESTVIRAIAQRPDLEAKVDLRDISWELGYRAMMEEWFLQPSVASVSDTSVDTGRRKLNL